MLFIDFTVPSLMAALFDSCNNITLLETEHDNGCVGQDAKADNGAKHIHYSKLISK